MQLHYCEDCLYSILAQMPKLLPNITRYSRLFRHPFKFAVIPPRNFSFRSRPILSLDISNGIKTI